MFNRRQTKQDSSLQEYDEFLRELDDHVWSFELKEPSFYQLSQTQRKEIQMWNQALSKGPAFVRAYNETQRRHVYGDIHRQIEQARNEASKSTREYMEKMVPTGDPEFDEFRRLVFHHDWYYSYSDDGDVWRAGEERDKKIAEALKKHGGLYKIYYDKMCPFGKEPGSKKS